LVHKGQLPQQQLSGSLDRVNLSEVLDGALARPGIALTIDQTPRTFADIAQLARGGAHALRRAAAKHVVYLAVSGPAFPLVLMAAARAGVPFTPLNYRLAGEQIGELLERFDDPLVVLDPVYAALAAGYRQWSIAEFVAEAAATDPTGELATIDDSAVAVTLFTSGTTAKPKSVLLRHATLAAYVTRATANLVTQPGDTSLVAVPPYHVMGVTGVLNSHYAGRRMVFLPSFSPEGWLELAKTERVTSATLVPTMVARIVRHLDGREADTPTLRNLVYGGSKMPRSVLEQALRAFPAVDFANGYGLTETSAGITALTPDDHRAALASDDPAVAARLTSAGRPGDGVELQVRSPDGAVLAPGEIGELWVRGPTVSGEYSTGSVLDADGWFPTRDQAHIDADGYLFIHGRNDDTIIRGGENIAPAEIEDVLDAHPAVYAVAVVGLPDEEWGQRVVAAVVAEPGTRGHDLALFVRERLRGSRTPDQIVFLDELPQTDTGKVQRRALVARLLGD
jgi:acyl-CoA synthetase (AMP-forming)/AMP-acid ligase II